MPLTFTVARPVTAAAPLDPRRHAKPDLFDYEFLAIGALASAVVGQVGQQHATVKIMSCMDALPSVILVDEITGVFHCLGSSLVLGGAGSVFIPIRTADTTDPRVDGLVIDPLTAQFAAGKNERSVHMLRAQTRPAHPGSVKHLGDL
ncbi:hypothetical protein [Mycobacterium dioxanotrophicus]|uniref:hypothetical protein n=1 Tax=Mycobacterium dioxanotrophicus TaxID=482462 RepID=UPI0012F9EC7F|nr:hypothetical protein [Mycobacterium dioxanotrophicus]